MTLKHLAVELDGKSVKDDGTFEGYASVFGNVDQGRDIVAPGAFKDSLAMRPASKIKMLWQHQSDQPIGVYTDAAEDSKGLYVKGQIAVNTTLGRDAYELMKQGAVDGMSIGFITLEDDYDRASGIRTLKTVDLREISVVTFPMNEAALVSAVKQEWTEKDVERVLREAGLPREFAKRVTLQGYKRAKEQFDDPREVDTMRVTTTLATTLIRARAKLLG